MSTADTDPDAMYDAGTRCEDAGDVAQAREFYEAAAALGHGPAVRALGVLLQFVDGDVEGAREYYERAAALGDGQALNNLGLLRLERGDKGEGCDLLRQAADAGYVGASLNLATIADADGDTDAAREWNQRAAAQGSADGMYRLGVHFEQAGDPAAITWYTGAATAGHVAAMVNLGALCVRDGMVDLAVTWWEAAAREGSIDAMVNLGGLFEVFPERGSARTWFEMAAGRGDEEALARLVELDAQESSD